MKNLFSLLLILMSTSLFAQNYTYLDGSANKYIFLGSTLEYVPVTPEKSSSGEYSGGTAKKVELSSSDVSLLKSAFDKAMDAKTENQENREMMTGMVIKQKKKKKTEIILKSDSAAKKEVEELLKKLIAQ